MHIPHLTRRCQMPGFGSAVVAGLALAMFSGTAVLASAGMEQDSPLTLAPRPQLLQAAPANDGDWHLVASLGFWGMSVDGTVGTPTDNADINMDFKDIIDDLNWGFMPGVEVSKDRWLLAFNGLAAQLSDSESVSHKGPLGEVRTVGADFTFDLYIADLAIGYVLFDIPLGDQGMALELAPAVGVRYTMLDLTIDPDRFESDSGRWDWWDPYVGGRVRLKLTDTLAWRNGLSIGGFGVGCDLTWAVQSMIDWRFYEGWELNVGYRALYQDYEHGNLKWDVTMQGPWLGVSYYFF